MANEIKWVEKGKNRVDAEDSFGIFGQVIMGRDSTVMSCLYDPINQSYHSHRYFSTLQEAMDNVLSAFNHSVD